MKLSVKRYNTRRPEAVPAQMAAAPAPQAATYTGATSAQPGTAPQRVGMAQGQPAAAQRAGNAAQTAHPSADPRMMPPNAAGAQTARPVPPQQSGYSAPRPNGMAGSSAAGPAMGQATGTTAGGASSPPRHDDMLFDTPEDGFDSAPFPTSAAAQAQSADPDLATPTETAAASDIDAIRREGLTGRQLRMARRMAQKYGLPATSDFDAVRLLRAAGIDPFQKGSMLDIVAADEDEEDEMDPQPPRGTAMVAMPNGGVRLPQTIKPAKLPANPPPQVEVNHAAELLRIQQDLVRRRRRRSFLLALRLLFFVALPTLMAGYYYYNIATPFYATKTAFTVQQADPSAGASSAAGSMRSSAATVMQDPISVQEYLISKAAMLRLESDVGFREYYSDPAIDPIQRLEPNASDDATYKVYLRNVLIAFDPTEGVIKMEVISPDPQVSVKIAEALIGYAEEQVDQMTQRLREDQMQGARESYEDAERKRLEAQNRVVELQKRFKILSSDAESTLITQQVSTLEGQLTKDRLGLAQLESNENPNQARVDPLKRRIATMEAQVADLRNRLTEVNVGGGQSLADVQSELLIAEADVEVRTKMMAQAVEAMETARVAANRQVRYLSLSFPPVAPDDATYPRAFENTTVALLIFAGIYLMLSMTAAILREQVNA